MIGLKISGTIFLLWLLLAFFIHINYGNEEIPKKTRNYNSINFNIKFYYFYIWLYLLDLEFLNASS